jgi:HEAT repeat protein
MHRNKRVAVVLTALISSACAARGSRKVEEPLIETRVIGGDFGLEVKKPAYPEPSPKGRNPATIKPRKKSLGELLDGLKLNPERFDAAWELGALDLASLGSVDAEKVKSSIIEAMKFDSEIILPGLAVLGKLADPSTVAFMARITRNANSKIIGQLAKSLGSIPTEESVYLLLDMIDGRDILVEQAAVGSLIMIGPQAAEYLADVLANGNENQRFRAAEALSGIGSGSLPHLTPLLGHPDPKTVYYALTALGNIGDKSAAPEVLKLMSHQDGNVRGTAANALRKLGDKSAIPVLEKSAQNDNSEFVRAASSAAVQALRE